MGDNTQKIMTVVLTMIIAVIIIFQFVGTSSDDIVDAADSITDATNCSDGEGVNGEAMFYNASLDLCVNDTPDVGDENYSIRNSTALDYDLPLNSLFSSSGVLILILMAGILIFIVKLVIGKNK